MFGPTIGLHDPAPLPRSGCPSARRGVGVAGRLGRRGPPPPPPPPARGAPSSCWAIAGSTTSREAAIAATITIEPGKWFFKWAPFRPSKVRRPTDLIRKNFRMAPHFNAGYLAQFQLNEFVCCLFGPGA